MENAKQHLQSSQIYKYSDLNSISYILGGIAFFALGFVIHPIKMAVGAVMLGHGIVFKKLEVIRIYPTYSEIKLSALVGRFHLEYSKIIKVELVKNNLLHITYVKNGKDAIFKLPIVNFSKKDREEIKMFYLNFREGIREDSNLFFKKILTKN